MESKLERSSSKESLNDVKSLQEVESSEGLDFDKIDLVKGETPADIEDLCLKLCQDYLAGNWCRQTLDTIEVRRVSGGFTNQLYYCGINEISEEEGVPQEVAIRLYGPKYFDTCGNESNERFSDGIVALMVSEMNLGPKIYGIFEGGQIQKFYKHRTFRNEEQQNPKLAKELMQRLAKIHAMKVPIKKNTKWLSKYMYDSIDLAWKRFDMIKEMKEYNCPTLLEFDVRDELNWLEDLIQRNNCQIVFTHHDFRSSNLMVTETNDELVICDFESATYGHRGHDFANIMKEWGRNCMDFTTIEGLPPKDSIIKPLVEMYIEESERIIGESYSQNKYNSIDSIIREGKIFLLSGLLFGTVFFLRNDNEFPLNRKVSMELSENNFKNYFELKQTLIGEKTLTEIFR